MAAKCQVETSRSICSTGCNRCMVSHQCREPSLLVPCLQESPRLWKRQGAGLMVTHAHGAVIGTGKQGEVMEAREKVKAT